MNQDDIIEVYLHGMSHDGRAVGRLENGLTVFVQNGLVGQKVQACITSVKKKLLEATCTSVLEPSEYEVKPYCKHSLSCGGCPWMGLGYAKQLEEKSLQVKNALIRIGHFKAFADKWEHKILPIISAKDLDSYSNNPENTLCFYRNKMEFAFKTIYGVKNNPLPSTKVGLKRRYSHEIIEVNSCKLQNPISMEILAKVRTYCQNKDLPFLRYLVLRTPNTGKITAELITFALAKNKYHAENELNCINELAELVLAIEGVDGFIHSLRTAISDVAYAERIVRQWGQTELVEEITLQKYDKSFSFQLGVGAFFQINTAMSQKLYQVIYEFASLVLSEKNNHIWDIYCGLGSIGLCLSDLTVQNKQVIENKQLGKLIKVKTKKNKNQVPFLLGIESSSAAISLAKKNAKDFDFCRFEADDAKNLSKYFKELEKPDLIIFDPPRAGVDKEALQAVLKNEVPYCIMVSCEPSSLARDLEILAEKYNILAVQAVDMFFHTPHVEVLVLLSLK